MIIWVAFFLNDWTASFRLDGKTEYQESVKIGTSLGSLVAPILIILFTAPLFKILTKDKNAEVKVCGYVDDDILTSRSQKKDVSTAKIQKTFVKVEAWVIKSGMIFDPAKFKAIHFSRKQNFLNPEIFLPPATTAVTQERPRIIKPVAKKESMRWLEVYFNHRLSFANHAEKITSKGYKAVLGLSMLVNTTRGVEAVIMRKAVHACILPILTYVAPAW